MADEITRDNKLISVFDDALVCALGSSLDGILDFVVSSLLLEANDEVNHRDINGRDTEGKTAVDRRLLKPADKIKNDGVRKFPVEGRNDLANSFGGTGRRGDDVGANGTTSTPVLVRRTIDRLLGCGGRVNGGHQPLDDAEVIMDNFGQRCQAVCRARGVRDDGVLGVICIQVNTTNEHGGIGRRSGDNDLLGPTLQMGRGPVM